MPEVRLTLLHDAAHCGCCTADLPLTSFPYLPIVLAKTGGRMPSDAEIVAMVMAMEPDGIKRKLNRRYSE